MPRLRDHPDAADALARAAPLATRWIQRLLAAHEPPLTVTEYLALRAIGGGPLAAVELAERAGVSGAAVSQLVAQLEGRGLVERDPSALDRRRVDLTLSTAGAASVESASASLRAGLGSLLAPIPRPERDALARLLEHVEAALAGSPPPRRPPRPPGPPKHRPGPRR
jgi:DNA-binding MarR family transcriptional regulator